MIKNCNHCVFFRAYPDDPSHGECWANPPVVLNQPETPRSARPKVEHDEFCRFWTARAHADARHWHEKDRLKTACREAD